MGEFQYYEFHAIDRELSKKERNEVDGLSSRFSPTSRKAVFSYSYSSFKHDEESVLLKYFDFFIYLSNWGTKRIMYKFPFELVNYDEIKKYVCSFSYEFDNELSIYKKADFVIIDINLSDENGGYWLDENEGSYWSPDLIDLRKDILNGDYRSLFIVWLHLKSLEYNAEKIDSNTEIPKQLIPDNLNRLNSGLKRLIELYEIDKDWISGALKYSSQSKPKKKNYKKIIEKLSIEKKNEYLIRMLDGELNLSLKLKKEIEGITGKENKKQQKTEKITIEKLLGSVSEARLEREMLERKKEEIKRLEKLKETEKNKKTILEEIDYHIRRGNSKSYDEALIRILNLRDLAKYKAEELDFGKWMNQLKKEVKNKSALMRRINEAGL